jgi:hypothetical protein
MTGQLADKAKTAASSVGHKAEDATYAVGNCMTSFAGTMRENLPKSGIVGAASCAIANTLDRSGQYLKQEGLKGMGEDVTNLIRRNPIPAMLVGFGLGCVVARVTARR